MLPLAIQELPANCLIEVPCVLKACSGSGNLWVGLQVHGPVVKVGLDSNLFIGNGLVAMYGKCGCLVEAYKVLDTMPVRDVVSWNSMVVGYAQHGRFDDALEVCRVMQTSGVKPDSGTMASLLPAVTNTSVENVMVVNEMFVNHKESLVSWNVMIAVYVNNSMPAKAIDIYLHMETSGMEPDVITFASVLPACGDLAAILIGRRIHEYAERKGLRPNILLENALIDMYAKCGTIEDARKVFDIYLQMESVRDVPLPPLQSCKKLHGLRCCSETRTKDTSTPQFLKVVVSGVTEILRLISPKSNRLDIVSDVQTDKVSVSCVDDIVNVLKSDYEKEYFVTGIFSSDIYVDDCIFEDPTIKFRGKALYSRNLNLLVPFFDQPSIILQQIKKASECSTLQS